jgi:universal stress protein A
MLKLRTILLASDLSESSKIAFPLACSLARDHGAKLIVLYVVPSGTHQFMMLAQLGQGESAAQFENSIRRDLQHIHPKQEGIPLEYQFAQGEAATAIVKFASDNDCDLIVMGTHGRTGLKRVLLGSVAEHVMRMAPCPVLVVRQHSAHFESVTAPENPAAA